MIKHYIIDGNNLIGKIRNLWQLQQKDKQSSREKLAFLLDRYFYNKNIKVTLHFDGHPAGTIKTNKAKIVYSENKIADQKIKEEIEHSKNPKVIAVISSDQNVMDFAKVCSCTTITSENFAKDILRKKEDDDEESIQKSISDKEMKKLFGLEE